MRFPYRLKAFGAHHEKERVLTKERSCEYKNYARSRMIRAFVVVGALCLVPLGIDRTFVAMASDVEEVLINDSSMNRSLSSLFTEENNSPGTILDRIEEMSRAGITDERIALLGEITIPSEATEFREDSLTALFSFEIEGTSQSVLDELASLWSIKGWRKVSLGNLDGATFVKDEGMFQWVMVTCTQVGSQVCVVGNPIRS